MGQDFRFIENDSTKEDELNKNNNIKINASSGIEEGNSDIDIEEKLLDN